MCPRGTERELFPDSVKPCSGEWGGGVARHSKRWFGLQGGGDINWGNEEKMNVGDRGWGEKRDKIRK